MESDQAEGRDAVWRRGGVRHVGLRDGPWPAHRQTPGQVSTGAQGTGESGGATFWRPVLMTSHLCDRGPSILSRFGSSVMVTFHLLSQLILELCHKQPDEEAITPHLERIRIPAAMSGSGHVQVFTPLDLKP